MKTINGLNNYTLNKKSIVTLGTFDGVHIGHQKIIEKLNVNKKETISVLLTFFPHPRMILQDSTDLKLLNTIKEKARLLEKSGLDVLIIQPFTLEFSRLTALEFVKDILVNKLNIKTLVIGYDHRFGKNREGNFENLQELAQLYNFELQQIKAKEVQDVAISSTKIRNALQEGNIKIANSYLGYNYMLSGKVVHGKGLGKKWNYPTINIKPSESYKLIPKTGVYIVSILIDSKVYYGIMNIGFRPTISGKNQTIEIHILDFNKNLYEKDIQVCFIKRLRDEKKFNSVNNLINQIKKDENTARLYLKKNNLYKSNF